MEMKDGTKERDRLLLAEYWGKSAAGSMTEERLYSLSPLSPPGAHLRSQWSSGAKRRRQSRSYSTISHPCTDWNSSRVSPLAFSAGQTDGRFHVHGTGQSWRGAGSTASSLSVTIKSHRGLHLPPCEFYTKATELKGTLGMF